ncbi:MAG TPA: methionine--tRNA ligase [Pyrinomonadaceae bacterium]|jgi:methionyl-tRNA synthetase/methionyl-tRNA synthetase C-terminal region/beta chain|nr:methionine--tRNA ligase [Pyrinomonadaceae bacterium]
MTFYVTTPIYYANALPHLGHLYTMIVADTIARSKRQRGIETYFLTGTDEHGINIERAAQKAGRTPKEQADYVVTYYKKMTAMFGLDTAHGGYDIFMRTTEPFHYEGVRELWRRCARARTPKGNDAIYKGHYEGWFCAPCAEYKTEDEYQKPKTEGAPPTCLIHDTPLDRVSEESYFFRLSDYDEALLTIYESQPDFVRPESRRNEVISFVRGGLQDLAISRLKSSVSWGVPVPDDPEHTMYVWFDALINYITAIGFGNDERERAVGFERFWPALHLVGKDILRFHAVYWPAFLLAAGVDLPRAIVAHGMWLDPNGRKMSKTLGNTIELDVLEKHFSVDAIRYFCLREMVFGQDGRFGYEALIDRSNSDLASGLGNLSSRTLTMIARYCDGRIPTRQITEDKLLLAKRVGVDTDETTIAGFLEHARDQYLENFQSLSFSRALEVAWSVVARLDKMISDAKPWDLAKDENQKQTLGAVLYRAAEALRWLSVLLYPVMPESSKEIWNQLGFQGSPGTVDPGTLKWGDLQERNSIGEVKAIFPRIDKTRVMEEINNGTEPKPVHATEADAVPGSVSTETAPAPPMQHATEADAVNITSFIEIGDFAKVDLRVGQVVSAERVPKADKLLLLKIDIGEEQPRQVLAGIAQYYEPEKLINRKVVVVANLKPRKLRGFESQGMVVAASFGEEGRPVIATFTEDVPNGARLK